MDRNLEVARQDDHGLQKFVEQRAPLGVGSGIPQRLDVDLVEQIGQLFETASNLFRLSDGSSISADLRLEVVDLGREPSLLGAELAR